MQLPFEFKILHYLAGALPNYKILHCLAGALPRL